jgi:hypothetical protein
MQGQQKGTLEEELCELAAQEQNRERLMELIAEINRLLRVKGTAADCGARVGRIREVRQLPNSNPLAHSLSHRCEK